MSSAASPNTRWLMPPLMTRPRMDGRVHAQLPHAREMRRVELVRVRQHPAQVLDRVLLVDRLDLIEEAVDRVRQVGVHVQRQASLGDLGRDLAPQRELLRLRIGLAR